MTTEIAEILAAKTVLMQTHKRDGSWVATPVSLVTDAGHTYFRTYDASGKAKRLRNFPEVKVTASSFRGKPHGPTVTGRARLLDGAEAAHAQKLLAARFPILHGRLVPWTHKRKGWTTLHYELLVDD